MLMQLCLGTVYAWSVYKKPLMQAHGWGETATQTTFMICIGMIGVCAAVGGVLMGRKGPRFVACMGSALFGTGIILAGLADRIGSIFLLWLGFGIIGGAGNGLAYVTPVATLIKWFPDKRGLVTGLAVMGFGGGAFVMGQVAPKMINAFGVASTWLATGIFILIVTVGMSLFLANPPARWHPAGWEDPNLKTPGSARSLSFVEAVATKQWWMLWTIFFFNIAAGIGLLSQLSPLAQEIRKPFVSDPAALAVAGGSVLAIASLFNGLGRLFWAWLSDSLGRKTVFIIMFSSAALLYLLVPRITHVPLFTVIACYLLACYGGGFSVMPAFVADSFGSEHVGKTYGTILTAWSAAGVAGPLIFSRLGNHALYAAAAMLMAGLVLAVFYKKPAMAVPSCIKKKVLDAAE